MDEKDSTQSWSVSDPAAVQSYCCCHKTRSDRLPIEVEDLDLNVAYA